MGLVEDCILLALNRIKKSQIGILGKIDTDFAIQSVSSNGTDFDVNLPASSDLSTYFTNQLFYITGTSNQGFHLVNTVDDGNDLITASNLDVQTVVNGILNFYTIDLELLSSFAEIAINTIETFTQTSFRGIQTFTEFISGTGSYTATLPRKKITSLTSVELVSPARYPSINEPITISVSDLNESQYKNKGLLQFETILANTQYNQVRYFPAGDNNIKVTGTVGYEEVDVPSAVKTAISLETAAIFLAQDANEEGGLSNFSIDAYSEGYSNPEGRFGGLIKSYRNMAKSLLAPYKTGVR